MRNERENQMAFYKVKALYEYEGVVSADTQDEAEKAFLSNLNSFYSGTESIDFTIVCGGCELELDLDGSCFDCDTDEEEED
jgi:hypothetical protein